MRLPAWFLAVAISLPGLAMIPLTHAQADDLQFMGAQVSTDKTEVMLVQKSTGNGRWVSPGQVFAGYTVVSYNAKTGQLTLAKDQQTRVLTLKTATVLEAKSTPTPPSADQQKAIMSNLRQLAAASDQYFLEHGVSTVDISKLVGTGPAFYIKVIKPVAGETYTGMVFEQGKPIRVKTAAGFEMEYAP